MKQIRWWIFETNSSSSHSVSIGPIKRKEISKDIPRNVPIYEIPEYKVANGHTESTIINTLITEVSKLSFLFNVIASFIYYDYEEGYDGYIVNTLSCLCGRAISEADPNDQKKAISQDLIYMRWLREIVQEETGTLIKIPIPESNEFPYFDVIYFTGSSGDLYDELWKSIEDQDEALFKSLAREIVFNPEIIIKDSDESYYYDIKENTL